MSGPNLDHLNRCIDCGRAINKIGGRKRCDEHQAQFVAKRKAHYDSIRERKKIARAKKPVKTPEQLWAEGMQRETRG